MSMNSELQWHLSFLRFAQCYKKAAGSMNLQLSVSVRAKTPTMTHLAPLGSSPPKSINGLSLPVCARNLETQMDRIHLSLPPLLWVVYLFWCVQCVYSRWIRLASFERENCKLLKFLKQPCCWSALVGNSSATFARTKCERLCSANREQVRQFTSTTQLCVTTLGGNSSSDFLLTAYSLTIKFYFFEYLDFRAKNDTKYHL